MKKQWLILIVLVWLVPACGPAQANQASDDLVAQQAWFDAPLPGSIWPQAPVQLISHYSDPDGIATIELSVNGTILETFPSPDTSSQLVVDTRNWTPPQPGNYTLQVRSQNKNGNWGSPASVSFTVEGEIPVADDAPPTPTSAAQPEITATPAPTSEPEACTNRIQFAGETVPDNSVFAPETPFTKTWTLINAGSCTWTRDYVLAFFDGASMAGSNLTLHKEVQPGDNIVLSMNLTAPANEGAYQGWWMLQDEAGEFFGLGDEANAPFWVLIQVQAPEQSPDNPLPLPSGGSDTQLPVINSLTFSPGNPTSDDLITFNVTASDNVGVARIDIYFNLQGGGRGQPIHSCTNSTTCTFTGGLYAGGQYSYFAYAFDAAGNYIQSFTQTVQINTIVK